MCQNETMTQASPAKAPTPRARAREQTLRDIVRIGREHLAVHGAAALSLRAVARDLGVVSSAVYRYVESREELLTLLLVDAHNELGDEVDAAVAALPDGDHSGRFAALGLAVRGWALREPASYSLLFGSPVPGYQAPADRTTGPGTRVVVALVGIIDGAWRAGTLQAPAQGGSPGASLAAPLAADLAAIRAELDVGAPESVLARGMLVWTALFGAVSFEVFGQYGAETLSDPEALFRHHLAALAGLAGFGA